MKKNALLSLSFVFILVFTACNSNTPKAAAEKFLSGIYQLDYSAAKAVATEDTRKMLDMYEQFTQNLPDSNKMQFRKIKIDIKSVKEEKDNATITYVTSDNPHEQTLHMIKQNEKWMAHWTKEDAKTDSGEIQVDQSQPTDTGATSTVTPIDSGKTK
jgi:GH25 family lysozyme M1 (1,4-beta-N-acetylmuramidase)